MSSLFQQLEIEAFRKGITPRTKESIRWFQQKAREMGKVSRTSVMQDDALKLRNRPITKPYGNMYMYFYDAKHKDTLPYYDGFPLVIPTGPAPGGFYGLNLHYLPLPLRAKALDALLGDGGLPAKYIAPMIHRYLFKQVRSRFALVEKPEWEIATFLPTADFRGAGKQTVYRDSRRKM
jgi:hypothetical protein